MRKLSVFEGVSLDGFFSDPNGDMSWAHAEPSDEWNAFVEGNARGDSVLVFGRITYDIMASFWPTPMAAEMMPAIAERMNSLQKIVFSRSMQEATWINTRLVTSDPVDEIRKLKSEKGPDLTILGSGSLVSQLADALLVDEFQLVIRPLILGQGKTPFASVTQMLRLKHTGTRSFSNGNVVLTYEPVL